MVRVFALGVAITGCGDDGAGTVDDGSTSSTGGPTSMTSTTSTSPTSTSPTAPGTDSDATTGSSETTADESSSTGDPALCGISMDPAHEGEGPWFELRNDNVLLADGGTLVLECGGQGQLMFYLRSTQGGFLPEGETVYYAVTLDVPGFDDLSPTGHFFQDLAAGVDVGCAGEDEFEGGFTLDGVAVFPPDALTEPAMVDGLSGTVHIEMEVPGGKPIVLDAAVTLEIGAELSPETCGFG